MVQMQQQQRAMAKQQVMQSMAQQQGLQQQQQFFMAAQQAKMQGMPPPAPPQMPNPAQFDHQAEVQLGPEPVISIDEWMNDASREILAGSMRKMDPKAKVENLNVALNQLAPAVVNLPGGAEFVAHIAAEFAKENKYSLEFQEAANKFASQCAQVTDMQIQMQTHPATPPQQGTPNKGPQSGPKGGHNPQTG
jgi:hypothetical protein